MKKKLWRLRKPRYRGAAKLRLAMATSAADTEILPLQVCLGGELVYGTPLTLRVTRIGVQLLTHECTYASFQIPLGEELKLELAGIELDLSRPINPE